MSHSGGVIDERAIAERYRLLRESGGLDERGQRLWAAAEACSHGQDGIAAVVRANREYILRW